MQQITIGYGAYKVQRDSDVPLYLGTREELQQLLELLTRLNIKSLEKI